MGRRMDKAGDFMNDNHWWVIPSVMVVVVLTIWVGKSYFEARTYSRLTGHQVTWVDALFVQLRVSDVPARQDED